MNKYLKLALELAHEYAHTLFEMLFILNGLAAFLILFDLVDSTKLFRYGVGALALAFAGVAFASLSNHGVKYQIKAKKGSR